MEIAIFSCPGRGKRDEFLPFLSTANNHVEWVRVEDYADRFPNGADLIILPGSATTVADLEYLRESGGERIVREHLADGGTVVGICGGFQILGNRLYDPLLKQGPRADSPGFGLLPIQTLFGPNLISTETTAKCLLADGIEVMVAGEEHRSGYSWDDAGHERFIRLNEIVDRKVTKALPEGIEFNPMPGINWAPGGEQFDGWVSADRKIWGTYIHLIFANEAFRRALFGSMS